MSTQAEESEALRSAAKGYRLANFTVPTAKIVAIEKAAALQALLN
jgi:hypothetical protein